MNRQIVQLEHLFKALADSTRLRILALLATGEVCVCDIYESLRIPQPKASRHLAYLRRAKLVEARRDGLWMHYRLAEPTDQVLGAIQQAVRHVLGHVGEIRQDAVRLQKKTGCCLPAAPRVGDGPALSCCSQANWAPKHTTDSPA